MNCKTLPFTFFKLTAFCFTCAGAAKADDVFETLHSFGPSGPIAPLLQAEDGSFCGVMGAVGSNGFSAIFRVTTNGALTLLYSFANRNEGVYPRGLMQASDGNLYGTAAGGGAYGNGTIFRLTTDGQFSLLYSFTGGADGGSPVASLVQADDGHLYGTASVGGIHDNGTVFRLTLNGAFMTLHSFNWLNDGSIHPDADGAEPQAALVKARDGSLYGTTVYGGVQGDGTVFRITTNGVFTTLHSFNYGMGAYPSAALTQAGDGNLYGISGNGTIFQISTGGAFNPSYAFPNNGYSLDRPGGLARASDGSLYGTYICESTNVFFRIGLDGVMTTIRSFTLADERSSPTGGLLFARDGNLYGTTLYGGEGENGLISRITTNGDLTTLASLPAGQNCGYPEGPLVEGSEIIVYCGGTDGWDNFCGTHYYEMAADGGVSQIDELPGVAGTKYHLPSTDGNLYILNDDNDAKSNIVSTIFRITLRGGLARLVSVTNASGTISVGRWMEASDGNLYGTVSYSQEGAPFGAVLRITTNGILTTLYSFGAITNSASTVVYGPKPDSTLVQAPDGNLYGTTLNGGAYTNEWGNSLGTIFRITPAGVLTTLYSFGAVTNGNGDALDGGNPDALIVGRDGSLYGTANGIFRITTNGVFTALHYSFDPGGPGYTGASGGLLQAGDGNFYGITSGDTRNGMATIFRITTNGTLTTLHTFTGLADGFVNGRKLMQASDGNLYGTTFSGGVGGQGTVFRLRIAPPVLQFPKVSSGAFSFSLQTLSGQSYTVQQSTNLTAANWMLYTNLIGDGSVLQLKVPIRDALNRFFRVGEP